MAMRALFSADISLSVLAVHTVTGLWVTDAPFQVVCSLVTSLWEPTLENLVYNAFAHHYILFLLLSRQEPKLSLSIFCTEQLESRTDTRSKLQCLRPQDMVWVTDLELKPGSPHLPCHRQSHIQIKASATASARAAAALQTNRRGDMTKQVKALTTCGQ